jgi:hypothetical protein
MIPLRGIHHRFGRRLQVASALFNSVNSQWQSRPRRESWALLEGLLSATWQPWCAFCRETVIASALGCQTRAGIVYPPAVAPVQWERASYIAICAKSKAKPKASQTNSLLFREPTWGDVNSLIDIIQLLHPANETQLLSAFGTGARGPNHLQIVRNAAAHINFQTIANVRTLRAFYIVSSLRHPSDVALWVEPSSGASAFESWLEDLTLISDLATA